MRWSKLALLVVSCLGLSLIGMAPARADVIHVGPGESIQAAVDAASPGDTIIVSKGTYSETIAITKDNLTLIGAGADNNGSILVPPDTPDNLCSSPQEFNGFCMFGDFGSFTPVTGTTIKGFVVRGFSGFGIFGVLSNDQHIANNLAEDNTIYGIACFLCSGGSFVGNTAIGSEEAGFYVGDSPDANLTIVGNVAKNNGFGFFLRDAANGAATDNFARDNCIGMLLMDTGASDVMGSWDISANNIFHNNRACPESEEGPPFSGVGIALLGGVANNIHNNTVWRNSPGGETAIKGGIFVASGAPFGGGDPTNNTVDSNVAYGNRGLDIRYTGEGTGNTFTNNDCGKSKPRVICD